MMKIKGHLAMEAKEDLNVMVERAILLLDRIYQSSDPVGISQLAQELNLPKVTAFRILKTLEKYHYVLKDEDNHTYQLGYLYFDYAKKIENKLQLSDIMNPFMKKLAAIVEETVSIGILYRNNILTVKTIEGDSFALMAVLDPLTPLHSSSMGKVFLARRSDDEIRNYYSHLKKIGYTHLTIKTSEEFLKEKERVLQEGIAFDNEEYEYGLSCMAAPLLNSKQEVIAALGVSGPTNRIKYKGTDFIKENLRETAREACQVTKKVF